MFINWMNLFPILGLLGLISIQISMEDSLSGNPDQMPHFPTLDLDLHYSSMSNKKSAGLI